MTKKTQLTNRNNNLNSSNENSFFIKGSQKDLTNKISQSELTEIVKTLYRLSYHNTQPRTERAPIIFTFILTTKIYDEQTTQQGKPYKFQIYPEDKKEITKPRYHCAYYNLYERVNNLHKPLSDATWIYPNCVLNQNQWLKFTDREIDFIDDLPFTVPEIKRITEIIQHLTFSKNNYRLFKEALKRMILLVFQRNKSQ